MNSIVERIQKLLSLANSSNQHEAELAANKAQELLVKYNLTMSQVEADAEEYMREDIDSGRQRENKENTLIMILLQDYFFIQIVSSRKFKRDENGNRLGNRRNISYIIMGKKHNVEIAKFVGDFLEASFHQLWDAYQTETGSSVKSKNSFFYGLYRGLRQQLDATRTKIKDETGLVVVPDAGLKAFVNEQFSDLKFSKMNTSINDRDALNAGHEQGLKLRIAKGLNTNATNSGRAIGGKV